MQLWPGCIPCARNKWVSRWQMAMAGDQSPPWSTETSFLSWQQTQRGWGQWTLQQGMPRFDADQPCQSNLPGLAWTHVPTIHGRSPARAWWGMLTLFFKSHFICTARRSWKHFKLKVKPGSRGRRKERKRWRDGERGREREGSREKEKVREEGRGLRWEIQWCVKCASILSYWL